MSIYGIIAFGVALTCWGSFLPVWWRKGNIWKVNFENWHNRPWSARYSQGQYLSIGVGFAMCCGVFIAITASRFFGHSNGSINNTFRIIVAVMVPYIFICLALYFAVAIFKWPHFLVPPWGRDNLNKMSKKSRKRKL